MQVIKGVNDHGYEFEIRDDFLYKETNETLMALRSDPDVSKGWILVPDPVNLNTDPANLTPALVTLNPDLANLKPNP